MEKIKVLTVIESLGKGGAERVLVNTLPELNKLNIECQVAILFKNDDLALELENKNIYVHRLNLSHKWNIFEARRKISDLDKEYSFDIIHSHLFFAHFHTAITFLFNKNIKKVVTFHNLGFDEYPANNIIKKIRKKIESILVNKFDLMTAVSTAVKKHYVEHLKIKKNVNVVFNSFPIESFNKYKIKKENYQRFTVMTPGRLVPKKGHKYLIESINILNEKNYDIDFLIIGSGLLKNEISESIKNLNNVKLIDAIPHHELMQIYNNVDLIVIPSIYEAFGLVVGEAMIMNTPVVATKVDGIVEIIENEKEGLLVESKNPEELANAIEKLYYDRDLGMKLMQNASIKIKQFDTKNIAQKWKSLYEELLYAKS